MNDSGDIWQRYDAKVLHVQQLEARVAELEREVATGKHERDHWARVARQLSKKLQVARDLAQRLRAAQHEPPPAAAQETQAVAAVQAEFDRAREVLGLVLSALTRALDDNNAAAAELGRRLRDHAGGKLLQSITRGSLTLVPLDGRYLVDRTWLERLDLAALRGELDAAQPAVQPRPRSSSLAHTEPPVRRPELLARLAELERSVAKPAPEPGTPPPAASGELHVELEQDEFDAYSDVDELPPPPPMPAPDVLLAPPPLLAALPADDVLPPPAPTEPPRRSDDTIRGKIQSPAALSEVFIPNLRIGRLIKSPGGG